ncbi:MAG TPA: 50S ribosomal protein L9, partial [Armatimonadota bacterium]|nr:50S ribosomal protein L9 [Armatimonadota bacterium]
MKVILTEEVAGLGEPGKIVEVAPGYARNYLVPRKLAVYASKASTRELEHHRQRLERKRQKLLAAARGTTERINGRTVTIDAKVGQGGKLF